MKNILLILLTFTLFACKDKDSGISSSDYELSADGLTLLKWRNENTTALDMQADPILRKVQVIGKEAFYLHKNIMNITLPDDLQRIEKEAFSGCQFRSIIIPKKVQIIGIGAFKAAKLTSVEFPEGLITIDAEAFNSCQIPSFKLPESLQTIGSEAFVYNYAIVSVTIPKNVQKIGYSAFYAVGGHLVSATFKGVNPPQIINPIFYQLENGITRIYVPKGRLEVYKNDERFKRYSDVLTEEE